MIKESFEKVENLDRKSLYSIKESQPQKECVPLVMDYNPALPPLNKIIYKHKYILKLDNELSKIINPENIFVSYRSNKSIKDMLICNKLKSGNDQIYEETGCFKCNKCYLCKLYLKETKTYKSYHSNQVFRIQNRLTCDSKYVVYLIDCDLHKKSYIGYTTTNMKTRFSNNKSHIKSNKCTCEIITHLIKENHNLDISDFRKYDESLSKSVSVTIIEKVKGVLDTDSIEIKEAKCERREAYWQRQLKTFKNYGGLNKRGGKKYLTQN